MKIEYIKNENKKLFSDFTNKEYLNLSEIQNYTPIYRSFFDLTNKNYKNVNFKTKYNLISYINELIDSQKKLIK